MKSPTRRGGPPVGLTREAILQAADRFEVPDLSMSALAKALGVSHAALYHWFPNKQAVIQSLVEATLQDVELPPAKGGPWQDDVLETASVLRRLLLTRSEHLPHVGTSLAAASTPISERVLSALDSAGFTDPEAFQLAELISAWCFYSAWQSSYLDRHDLRRGAAMVEYLDASGVAPDSPLRQLAARYTSLSHEEIFKENLLALLDRFSPSTLDG